MAISGSPSSKNPPWSLSEMVLLVELYQKVRRASPRHPEVIALSRFLNTAAPTGKAKSTTYRNPIGISMQLWNLGQQDTRFQHEQKVGRRNSSKLSIQVWQRFAGDS